jgi:alpha-methylacyl-CoA racemase
LEANFRLRTRDDWAVHFVDTDACVTPVLSPDELADHPFVTARHPDFDLHHVPAVPRFSRTPAVGISDPQVRDDVDVLTGFGMTVDEAAAHLATAESTGGDLAWPPIKDQTHCSAKESTQ